MPSPSAHAVLACDTSCPDGSVALLVNGHIYQHHLAQGTHAKLLVHAMDGLLREANITMRDVATLVTTLGPGSFTGIRISLAAVHGLILAVPANLKTCSSLAAIAYQHFEQHPEENTCEVWIGAGKGEAYTQLFTRTDTLPKPLGDIRLQPLEAIGQSQQSTCGNVAGAAHAYAAARSEDLCQMAKHLPLCAIEAALPIYVRAPDAKIPTTLPWLASSA